MFEPLYYQDKLQIVNPAGDIGVVTLWSPTKTIYKKLSTLGIDLDPHTSRIAVLGTLYGNGLPELLHNLLYNPQIAHLFILGQDLSGSRAELTGFFAQGLEETTYLGTPMMRIIGTDKHLDGAITPHDFTTRPLTVTDLSQYQEADAAEAIRRTFAHCPPPKPCTLPRIQRPLTQPTVQWYPSHPGGHTIIRQTPLEAWQELIFRLIRFGHRHHLRKGERIELQNIKTIVQEPVEEDPEALAKRGFSLAELRTYQTGLLDGSPPIEQSYTYGNRLRGYFQAEGRIIDTLETAIVHLQEDHESRRAYIALWDSNRDTLPQTRSHPCLVALFFRKWADRLTLTATFRSHNALDGWLKNCYGLMAVQKYVADRVPMPVGSLTVISHSISIDPQGNGLARAQAIAEAKKSDDRVDPLTGKRSLRTDPNGEFLVTTDETTQEIVVQHLHRGQLLKEYRAREPEMLEKMLARDCALSDIAHALYLGREMARCAMRLPSPSDHRDGP